ncbi:hypothetical protein BFINE_45040 [Bacteroides finegoldii DSM 17565]|nr:hypothetical protein BFINE_45040 [Bacteroides finegoldii DSM 17565]
MNGQGSKAILPTGAGTGDEGADGGLRYSRHAILREVVENEFAGEVPGEKCEAFTQKLLPLVGNVFSIYDLSDDNFALSPEYDLLYTELTGAVILYIEEYGV